ncbi:MAG: dTDP-4-dehydrorhamnose reductase [Burkholderiales bacterium]|nr:dTDP-4-dehydrorhamnose reductase [Burkholderiales bacterium]
MDILILGGAGQVGLELQRATWPDGLHPIAPTRVELDITDTAAIGRAVAARPWAAVVNVAAYTAVDKAESDVEAAWRLNALAPAVLAHETAKAGIPIVHVSTDYVFDGSKAGDYEVDDPVAPLGVYGASKEGGEQGVRTGNPRHAIVRTAWVVSPFRANFVKTMLRLAGERPSLRVVDDQHGCPTVAGDLARAIVTIAARLATDPAAPAGTYHFANTGHTTWCGLARAVMEFSAEQGGASVPVAGIGTADYPTPARRPANSRLSTGRITRDYGISPRPWRDAVKDVVAELSRT